MSVIHISAECFPYAKAGGLGDVVGALPKYQNQLDFLSIVIIPKYKSSFFDHNKWEIVYIKDIYLENHRLEYKVFKELNQTLGFELFVIEIEDLFDTDKIYGKSNDFDRFLSFQIACLDWISSWHKIPKNIHCHDYHTGLIPFMIKYCNNFEKLKNINTIFTIHNAEYQGAISIHETKKIPYFNPEKIGMLEWNKDLNPLACAIKSSDVITTVSENYLEELSSHSYGLGPLYRQEKLKSYGILNGIDSQVWDPNKDKYLYHNYDVNNVNKVKIKNKQELCKEYGLNPELPLIVFISRMVREKSADILPEAIGKTFEKNGKTFNFFALGSGDFQTEKYFVELYDLFPKNYRSYIGYKEDLAHKLYASADFLIMPSLVEPCGLNQLYSLRYGTIPIVRRVGGLKDTVTDIGEKNGFGITFEQPSIQDISNAMHRAIFWYKNNYNYIKKTREFIMNINHSWELRTQQYINLYSK